MSFYRLAPDASAGHGIGLALVGHIARAHGGSATFIDVPVGACLSLHRPGWSAADGSTPSTDSR